MPLLCDKNDGVILIVNDWVFLILDTPPKHLSFIIYHLIFITKIIRVKKIYGNAVVDDFKKMWLYLF